MSSRTEPWQNLPKEVRELKEEIELRIPGEVCFQESNDQEIQGAMTIKLIAGDLVVFAKDYSHAGAAEELLHAKLGLSGFMNPRPTKPNNIAHQALTILHNLLQHAVIFPELEAMGYPRDDGECKAVARQFTKLAKQELESARIEEEPGLLALLAMIYVRARKHCSEAEFHRLTSGLYTQAGYSKAIAMGEGVFSAIDLGAGYTAEQYNETLSRCLDQLGFGEAVQLVPAIDPDWE